jgi:hypothetical protein
LAGPRWSRCRARCQQQARAGWALGEQASFFGMRSAPALYMTTVLGFVLEDGAAILHRFIAAWFVAPLFAGYLADRDVDEPPGP